MKPEFSVVPKPEQSTETEYSQLKAEITNLIEFYNDIDKEILLVSKSHVKENKHCAY